MRIGITGLHSYIGNAVEQYLKSYDESLENPGEGYEIQKLSLRDEHWQESSFQGMQSILHVAGIAHADVGGADEEEKKRYYEVNCDLAVAVAKKAKAEGVKQFIYMSSVIVYGESAPLGKKKHITADTLPAPANFYGDSKWQAEQKLKELQDDQFHVAIVRCPMVYGKDSKGNYRLLAKLAGKLPIFPKVKNERSMIYIENLGEFLRRLLEDGEGGLFLPQNQEYTSTSFMVAKIRNAMGKKIWLCSLMAPFVHCISLFPGKIGKLSTKAFGSMTIDREFGDGRIKGYQLYTLEESIRRIHES